MLHVPLVEAQLRFVRGECRDLLTAQYMLIGWGKGDLRHRERRGEGTSERAGLEPGPWGPDGVQLLGDTQ